MPELPEVETVKNILKKDIVNKKIDKIDVNYFKIIKNVSKDLFINSLIGQSFIDVNRRGKHLIFELYDYYMVAHLRMEGKYFLMHDEPFNKHDHIIFYFEDGSNLRYNDVRKFGTIHLFDKNIYKSMSDLYKVYPLNVVGLEPFDSDMSVNYLCNHFKKKIKTPIKTVLLDQSIIAGLGNIYVDEVLYLSKIHPLKIASKITESEAKAILDSSIKVLNKAIELGGTTVKSFQSSHEISGRFQNELCVHTKELCPLGHDVKKIKVGGRGTYYCPMCQVEE